MSVKTSDYKQTYFIIIIIRYHTLSSSVVVLQCIRRCRSGILEGTSTNSEYVVSSGEFRAANQQNWNSINAGNDKQCDGPSQFRAFSGFSLCPISYWWIL